MDAAQIQQVRRFNRLVTQRVGALDDSYLRRGRPLSEARVVFETGPQGADVRQLRDRLGLDSGYLSRLLRSLETQGLISVRKQADDARVRRVHLTAKGRREFAAYDKLSDQLAQSMIAPLSTTQRERLVTAMAEVERLVRAAAVDVRVEAPDSEDACWCLGEYFRELAQRFESGFDPDDGGAAADVEMRPPGGCFVVARLDGEPIGCGGMKRLDATTGEIKRVWTAPAARGQGVARRMLRCLETLAREAGVTTLCLDTNRSLTEAQAMYRQDGYHEIGRYNDNPYAHHWFEKRLS
ncbi:MAG TPA: helix-turn-helix domain-containing GNAT family N-acetyltransferase [Acetobacteraceae bacterium]|jgi:DNA-binding MarR family transcriptional regulator/GNAT superfamily N-acetyltransferase